MRSWFLVTNPSSPGETPFSGMAAGEEDRSSRPEYSEEEIPNPRNSDTAAMTHYAKHHCKHCAQPLVKGRAYELGGYRWHVDCFQCNVCERKLDGDMNMLVLGNGTLVCSNCSYYCNICHKKIDDLAILTNDQAFCSSCFVCRNCKTRIDDLKYARTSQGIFCMHCHNVLLERKRQRSHQRGSKADSSRSSSHQPSINSGHEKQLPDLPGLIPRRASAVSEHVRHSIADDPIGISDTNQKTSQGNARARAPAVTHQSAPVLPTLKSAGIALSPPLSYEPPQALLGSPINSSDSSFLHPSNSLGIHSSASKSSLDGPERSWVPTSPDDSNLSSGVQHRNTDPSRNQSAASQGSEQPRPAENAGTTYPAKTGSTELPSHVPSMPLRAQDYRFDATSGAKWPEESAVKPPSTPRRGMGSNVRQEHESQASNDYDTPLGGSSKPSEVIQKKHVIGTPSTMDSPAQLRSPLSRLVGKSDEGFADIANYPLPGRALNKDSPVQLKPSPRSSPRGSPYLSPNISRDSIIDQSIHRLAAGITKTPQEMRFQSFSDYSGHQPRTPDMASGLGSPTAKRSLQDHRDTLSFKGSTTPASASGSKHPAPSITENAESRNLGSRPQQSGHNKPDTNDLHVPARSSLRGHSPQPSLEKNTPRLSEGQNDRFPFSPLSWRAFGRSPSTASANKSVAGVKISQPTLHFSSVETDGNSAPAKTAVPPRHHRRSISDTVGTLPGGSNMSLYQVQHKIDELSSELAQIGDPSTTSSDFNSLVLERKKTIAGLAAKQVVAEEELAAIRGSRNAESRDISVDFTKKLEKIRADLESDISQLTQEKERLKAEVGELNEKRDRALEESAILNAKNSQLVDMNNELLQQTIDKFGPSSLWGGQVPAPANVGKKREKPKRKDIGTGASCKSAATSGIGDTSSPYTAQAPSFANTVQPGKIQPQASPFSASSAQSSSASVSTVPPSNTSSDGPLVTVLDGSAPGGAAKHGKGARNIWPWKRSGKGLTRVFATELSDEDGGDHGQSGAIGMLAASAAGIAGSNSASRQAKKQPILGEDLQDRVAQGAVPVPALVTKCVKEVERRGLELEGIYRKSGSKSQVDSVLELFDHGDHEQLELTNVDISVVTSVLKQYLRYLSDPVITFEHYDAFVKAGRTADLELLQGVVDDLPRAHRDTLRTLMYHLDVVTQHGEKNLMTSHNLAVVFAPTLTHDKSGEREVADMQARNDATQLMIENVISLFAE